MLRSPSKHLLTAPIALSLLAGALFVPLTPISGQNVSDAKNCESIKDIAALQRQLISISAEMTRLQAQIDDLGPKIDKAKAATKPILKDSSWSEDFKAKLLDEIGDAVRTRSQLKRQLDQDAQLIAAIKDEISRLLSKLSCPPELPRTTTSPGGSTPKPTQRTHADNSLCPEQRKSVRLLLPQPLTPFDKRILDLHNTERAAVGAPPLEWNQELADHAAEFAQQLARTGQLVHAPRDGRGIERENLQQGLIGWGLDRLVGTWIPEKSDFVAGDFPNVARDGDWMKVAHYTQMIWPSTVAVGCGVAQGAGYSWFVCRYSPGGNKDGKPVGLPVQIAKRPCTDDAVVPNERG